jgi:hypothetical protein
MCLESYCKLPKAQCERQVYILGVANKIFERIDCRRTAMCRIRQTTDVRYYEWTLSRMLSVRVKSDQNQDYEISPDH